jgi:hypothetical protein
MLAVSLDLYVHVQVQVVARAVEPSWRSMTASIIHATVQQTHLQEFTHPLEGHDESEVHICGGTTLDMLFNARACCWHMTQ